MFTIKKYLNFNSAGKTEVKAFSLSGGLNAAICKYEDPHHSIFLIEEATFTCVVQGNKYMIINNEEFFLTAGDILFISPNSIVFTFIPKGSTAFESINIKMADVSLKPQLLLTPTLLMVHDPAIQKIIARLKNNLTEACLDNEKTAAVNCISKLVMYFNQNLPTKGFSAKLRTEDLEKIKTVLLETVYQQASISAIAKKCNMSVSTFKRKFELAFGIPPKTWKRNICLQTAYFNLKTGNYKVSEILENVGFDNFAHFSYAFKKQFNFSPSTVAENKLNQFR